MHLNVCHVNMNECNISLCFLLASSIQFCHETTILQFYIEPVASEAKSLGTGSAKCYALL